MAHEIRIETKILKTYDPRVKKLEAYLLNYIQQWSILEYNLSELLRISLNLKPQHSNNIAYAIYHAPSSIDARFSIINACITQMIHEKPILQDMEVSWGKIFDNLQRLRPARNILAHGAIISIAYYDKEYFRISTPTTNTRLLLKKIKDGNLPGLSENDMKNFLSNIEILNKCINEVCKIIYDLHHKKKDVHEASSERFARLEDYRRKLGGHK